ncbi:MAG: IS3 family transposase [Solirubrobacteraceae bacterium]
MGSTSKRYPVEIRDRAVRLVAEQRRDYEHEWAAIVSVAGKFGCTPETLRKWVRRAEVDAGRRPGVTSADAARIKELERENKELRRANEILKSASGFLRAGARPAAEEMSMVIDAHRDEFGVEPTCRVLGVAPSTYYAVKARERDPSQRALRDRVLLEEIRRIHRQNYGVYGARKVWWQLQREGIHAPRCQVERLMRHAGLQGAIRGRKHCTTFPNGKDARAADLVDRDFTAPAPDRVWVADFTYVATWSGVAYVAFAIDVFSRRIVGWKADSTMRTSLVLDTLEMALWARDHAGQPVGAGLVHHSDAGSQYTSFAFTQRLIDAGVDASIGSVGDGYDNALAESTIGLYKTELVRRQGPWKTLDQLELATLEWVDWYNHRRLHSSCERLSPAEFEQAYMTKTNQ